MTLRIAIAAFDPSTYKNQAIPNAGNTVRYVVLENSIANVPDQQYHDWIAAMQAAGQLVFGYVPVENGARTVAEVENGWTASTGHQFGARTWHASFPELSGIYLDEGPIDDGTRTQTNGQSTLQNYTDYYRLVKQYNSTWSVLVEAAGYPEEWIDRASDHIIVWEGDYGTQYKNDNTYGSYMPWMPPSQQTGPPAPWWRNPTKAIHQVTGASTEDLPAIFARASRRGAGAVYVPEPPRPGHSPVGLMPVGFPCQQILAGRTFALRSVPFLHVCLRIDGRKVTAFQNSGSGIVNCQFDHGPWEELRVELLPDAYANIASVQFPNVYLRMDGRGVTGFRGAGSGTVNCQFSAGAWEQFDLQMSGDVILKIASRQFPNVYLRMDGNGVTAFRPFGGGVVNCQFSAGPWELFNIILV